MSDAFSFTIEPDDFTVNLDSGDSDFYVTVPANSEIHVTYSSGDGSGFALSSYEWVSFASYNPDSTGVVDCTLLLNQAIAETAAAGKVLIIPPGEYKVSGSSTLGMYWVSYMIVFAYGAVFNRSGRTDGSLGWVRNANQSIPIERPFWRGGTFKTDYQDNVCEGHVFAVWANYMDVDDVLLDEWGGGCAWLYRGDHTKLENFTAINPNEEAGSGGVRFIGGLGGYAKNCTVFAGDDALQIVALDSGVWGNLDADGFKFLNCYAESTRIIAVITNVVIVIKDYNFSTSTSDTDPGNGFLRFNHATAAGATILYMDNVDADGVTIAGTIDTFDDVVPPAIPDTDPVQYYTVRGTITIKSAVSPTTQWKRYHIVSAGAVVNAGGYRRVTVVYDDGIGGEFTASQALTFEFAKAAFFTAKNITFEGIRGKTRRGCGIVQNEHIWGPDDAPPVDNIRLIDIKIDCGEDTLSKSFFITGGSNDQTDHRIGAVYIDGMKLENTPNTALEMVGYIEKFMAKGLDLSKASTGANPTAIIVAQSGSITDSEFDTNASNGVELDRASNMVLTGNKVKNVANGKYGFSMGVDEVSSGIKLRDNVVEILVGATTAIGVYLGEFAEDCKVRENDLSDFPSDAVAFTTQTVVVHSGAQNKGNIVKDNKGDPEYPFETNSASTVAYSSIRDVYRITGSGTVSGFETPTRGSPRVTWIFTGSPTINDNVAGPLRLNGNFVASPHATLTLQWNPVLQDWHEISRCVI